VLSAQDGQKSKGKNRRGLDRTPTIELDHQVDQGQAGMSYGELMEKRQENQRTKTKIGITEDIQNRARTAIISLASKG